jgi:hypothetical protein
LLLFFADEIAPPGRRGSISKSPLMGFSRVVVGQLFLVLSHAPVEFVYQAVDRSIHVFFGIVGINRTAVHVYLGFRFMPQLFYRENAVHVRHHIEVSLETFYLGLYVTSHCFCDFDVVARDI